MDCFRFAFRIGVLVLFFFCFGCSTDETAQEDASAVNESAQPNIVIILCDDLGYGDLSCYGNDIIKTPNLDEMAAQGIRFTDCYSAAPVCSPSRAGLITGRIPSRTGIYTWIHHDSDVHLKDDEITIADQLSRAGYSTGLFGKWHFQ